MKSKEVLLDEGIVTLTAIVGLPYGVEKISSSCVRVNFYDAIEGKVFLFSKDISVYEGWDHAALSGSEYNPQPLSELFAQEIKKSV